MPMPGPDGRPVYADGTPVNPPPSEDQEPAPGKSLEDMQDPDPCPTCGQSNHLVYDDGLDGGQPLSNAVRALEDQVCELESLLRRALPFLTAPWDEAHPPAELIRDIKAAGVVKHD